MMESVYSAKEKCTGCSACYNICPVGAITMEADEEGFLYPQIDQSICIDCFRCVNICPVIKKGNYKYDNQADYYAAQHKSEAVLRKSTSGGVFTAISDAVLKQNGIIYGAVFDNQLQVVHGKAVEKSKRNKMRISKYVQSKLGDTFKEIKDYLQAGKLVLFTGTPCQAAGLKAFIESEKLTENLYICDLICHSVPSPLIWEKYKELLEKEKGSKLEKVQFRTKKYAWSRKNSNKGFLYKTKAESKVYEDDRFYELFINKETIARPSCSECPFTDQKRVSDLTIADYFGIKKYNPDFYDPLGVSLILVNSTKGRELFSESKKDLKYQKRPSKEALTEQQRLSKAIDFPEIREDFWKDLRKFGLEYVLKNY